MRKIATIVCLAVLFISKLYAQNNYASAIGSPTFSTQIPIENGFINVNNGDIHIEIPLATHKQRGRLQLDEKLVYDSKIWKIVENGGYSWQPTNVPNSMGGWVFSSGIGSGFYTYKNAGGQVECEGSTAYSMTADQTIEWTWTDPGGTLHSFPSAYTLSYSTDDAHCISLPTGTPTGGGYASDGSGYFIQINNYDQPTIIDPQGNTYHPSYSEASSNSVISDSNGNYFSSDANGNLVDTLGRTPVLVTTNGNHIYYDVLAYDGSRVRYTVTTETVYYNTAFNQSKVSETSGSFTAIQSIELPDGNSYSLTYGSGTASGNYGELTSVTLPSGGVITYSYQNFLDSFQDENRWILTRVKDGGTTTFKPSTISNCTSTAGCQEKQTVTDPQGNDTVYTFNLDESSYFAGASWVTNVDGYQGSSNGGTKLKTVATSYAYTQNNVPIDEVSDYNLITTAGPAYITPATQTTVTTLDDVGLSTKTVTTFDVTGSQPSKIQSWDYYSGTAPSTPATETDYTYYSGPSPEIDGDSPSSFSFPSTVIQKDGAGNVISQTTYNYDQTTPTATSGLPNHETASGARANLTSVSQLIDSTGATLSQTMTYDDAGTLLSSTDSNGTTTYGHDSTDTFVTSTTPPTPSSGVTLTTIATYDFSTGLITSTTDPNGAKTNYVNYDWAGRALEIDNLDGSGAMVGKKTFLYDTPYSSAYEYQNASVYADTETMYDAYGRQSRVAIANGQSANPWYQTDTCYNTNGNVSFQSYRYQGAGFSQAKECSGGGDSTTYDALGRVTNVAHADGSATQYAYKGRATEQTDVNPSGTNVSRITQTDGLGRETIACEVSSNSTMPGGSGSPASCGTDIAATGFVTSFAYNLASHTQTITQGAQTRTFQTDSLGRTILTQEPERGQTTYSYSYNATGLLITRKRPKANQTSPTTLTTTTIQYDALGRLLQMSYDDNLTSQRTFAYDAACCFSNSSSATNVKGRLANTGAGIGVVNNAAALLSYDSMGRVTTIWQCTPTTCGSAGHMTSRPITMTYDWAGNLTQEYDPASGAISYGRSPAGEVTSITNQTYTGTYNPATLVSNVVNGPDGPISYSLGNGVNIAKSYDSMGRMKDNFACVGSSVVNCTGGTRYVFGNYVAFSGSQDIADCDSAAYNQYGNCVYPHYDDMGRMTSLTGASSQTLYAWTYDRYGNRWSQTGPSSFSASYDTTTNRLNSSPYTYDAAGNLTYDGQHHYTYDAEGNVLDVDLNQGNTAEYVYNVFNQRVSVQTASGTTEYSYDPSGLQTSSWKASTDVGNEGQIYWDGQQIAFRDKDGTTYFDHQDYLGTERDPHGLPGSDSSTIPFRAVGRRLLGNSN